MAGMPPHTPGSAPTSTGAIFWVQSDPAKAQVSGQVQGLTPLAVTVNGTQSRTTLVLHIDGRPDCKITYAVEADGSGALVVVSDGKKQRLTAAEAANPDDQSPALKCRFVAAPPKKQ